MNVPADHNGIVWLSTRRTPPSEHVFNQPWTDNLNPDLLYRYWVKKGRPGFLFTWHSGVKIWHRHIESVGTFSFVAAPHFNL